MVVEQESLKRFSYDSSTTVVVHISNVFQLSHSIIIHFIYLYCMPTSHIDMYLLLLSAIHITNVIYITNVDNLVFLVLFYLGSIFLVLVSF